MSLPWRMSRVVPAITALAVMSAAAPSVAQEVGARRGGAAINSPEVASDRRVTFRLRAPDAKAVTVSGHFGSDAEMRKGDDGIWSVSVGPLAPEMYVYYFTVDGVRLTDPNNPQVKIGYVTTTTTSLLTVPGDGPVSLGYGGAHVNGDGTGVAPMKDPRGDAALYERDLLEDIIPLIDRKYRTLADRKHRAIVGFSMGGGQAGRVGLRHLEKFSHVGIMSAGMAPGADGEPIKTLAADAAKSNKLIDLLWIACGTEDAALKGAKTLHQGLEQAGIQHTYLETEGAHHWRVWRRYLRDLAPLLFR